MAIDVREVDPGRDDDVAAVVVCRNLTDPEINPDDPPVGFDEIRGDLARATIQQHVRTWLATLDGQPAGEICFELDTDADNAHVATSAWLAVVPERRRRGVADALVRASLDAMAADGRTSLVIWGHLADPDVGAVYAARLGLEQKTEERCSRLLITDLDRDLVDRWSAEGATRTDGYRMVQFTDRCPDEHMAAYVEAIASMEDAPIDDLEWTPPETDAALAHSREQLWQSMNLTVARSLVLAPDGSGAGVSELFVNRYRPQLASQGDTGVVAAHRGHGLGRWLKAANLGHAERLTPGFEVVETYNAQTNPWMLDINVAMGFRPHVVWRAFQGDLRTARAAVA